MSMDAEHELRRLARRKMIDGELPQLDPAAAEAHLGAGEPCALCGLPLPREKFEFLLHFDRDWTGESLRMHIDCCRIWESERLQGPQEHRGTRSSHSRELSHKAP